MLLINGRQQHYSFNSFEIGCHGTIHQESGIKVGCCTVLQGTDIGKRARVNMSMWFNLQCSLPANVVVPDFTPLHPNLG